MNKICAIHQPNFMPWLGYFHKISNSDIFVILDIVDIEIGSSKAITNRTRIKTQNGIKWITIPLKRLESKLIKNILIDDSKDWRKTILKTLFYEYKKTQNFDNVFTFVETLINHKTEYLSEYNTFIITQIAKFLSIKTEIVKASDIHIDSEDRNMRLIEICKSQNSDIYLSGNGGKKYNDEQLFTKNDITIRYTYFVEKTYKQLYGDFAGGLSIIDYLFNEKILIF